MHQAGYSETLRLKNEQLLKKMRRGRDYVATQKAEDVGPND
jgi:hypothetical protein